MAELGPKAVHAFDRIKSTRDTVKRLCIVSVMRALVSLQHNTIAKTIHVEEPSPTFMGVGVHGIGSHHWSFNPDRPRRVARLCLVAPMRI